MSSLKLNVLPALCRSILVAWIREITCNVIARSAATRQSRKNNSFHSISSYFFLDCHVETKVSPRRDSKNATTPARSENGLKSSFKRKTLRPFSITILVIFPLNYTLAAPPLPPSLPAMEQQSEEVDKESLISDIKHFFDFSEESKKNEALKENPAIPNKPSQATQDSSEPFIDLGEDNELPAANNLSQEDNPTLTPPTSPINNIPKEPENTLNSLPSTPVAPLPVKEEAESASLPLVEPISSSEHTPAPTISSPVMQEEPVVHTVLPSEPVPAKPPEVTALPEPKAETIVEPKPLVPPVMPMPLPVSTSISPVSQPVMQEEQVVHTVLPSEPIQAKPPEVTALPEPNIETNDKKEVIPAASIIPPVIKEEVAAAPEQPKASTNPLVEKENVPPPALAPKEVMLAPVEVLPDIPQANVPSEPVILDTNNNKAVNVNSSSEQKNIISSNEAKQQNEIKEISPEAKQFAKNEAQVLLLPNDDIVLGELTFKAHLEQMDIYSYIKMVQDQEDRYLRQDRKKLVDSLINYDRNLIESSRKLLNKPYPCVVMNGGWAVKKNNLSALRVLLDTYPILQTKNRAGETLLHIAVKNNNYYATKFLLMHGIKISTLNIDCKTALDIAEEEQYYNISCILIKAGV